MLKTDKNRKKKLRCFIGSYTEMLAPDFGGSGEGIYTVEMDEITGEITVLHAFFLKNPAYLVAKDQVLYAITEVEQHKKPKVSALSINKDGTLALLNSQNIDGSLPCHINLEGSSLFIACYGSGNLLSFPIDNAGYILKSTTNFKHKGSSVNTLRQESPHAHQVVIHPNGRAVFVPDLGIDTIKAYTIENDELLAKPQVDIDLPKGSGPRHMVCNTEGSLAYVMNELTGSVAVLKRVRGHFKFNKMYKALPDTFKAVPSGAAIRLHPSGKFLYAANRTIDCITIFKIHGDTLECLGYQYMQGKTVREFHITPKGSWLIACLQDSNAVISYKIGSNGLLEEKHRNTTITSPVCICFLE